MPDETTREDEHEMHEDDGNIPGLPPFPDDMPEELRAKLREAHEGGGIGGLIMGALASRLLHDPNEEMRQGNRDSKSGSAG